MTRVSGRPLRKELEERMFEIFRKSFIDLKNEHEAWEFLEDLLSPTEKIMLSKRLAIATLLEKGWNYQDVSRALKVSTTTVNHVRSKFVFQGKGYLRAVKKIIENEEMADFWETLALDLTSVIDPIGVTTLGKISKSVARNKRKAGRRKRDIL